MTTDSTLPVFDFATRPDYAEFVEAAGSGRRHALSGFDADYVDIVDYIVRCTHKIWEEKAIGLIYTHYAHNALVHTASGGSFYGREQVVQNTLQNQAIWGDLRAYADDVIWGGDEEAGYYTSHRHVNTATHSGYTEYGPPTGRKIFYWGIADCLIRRNLIVEEWLTHDGVTIIKQMGYDPLALAKRAVLPATPHTHGEIDRLPTGQQSPAFAVVPDGREDPQGFIRAVVQNMWNARLINMVREHYAPTAVAFVPDSRKLYGHGDYENFVITLMACFPDLAVNIDHQCVLGDAERGYRVATRCTFQGTHEGYGPYGAPTGRRISMIVISHQSVQDGKITREWTVFNEFELLKQLYGQIGALGAL
ncbi:ester cyclase (plasmid) [Deinococcus sp. KNUC1210]|uniref:ester cyclase n=1 Tax=Deinococcus sp. KNUC1210 TaxID=2917691 RepID=UPI001EF0E611|nr:ester cyclase [Deinococcus sp. KNUC1210]ULH17725.1 ester cyclase [Deinococcus sp. KNUC1210]